MCKKWRVWYRIKNPDLDSEEYDACHNWCHKKCENIIRDMFNKFKGLLKF